MGRWQKILLGALSLLLVFTLFGFFVLPPLLKSVAMDKLSVLLHRPVSIARCQQQFRIDPPKRSSST